MVLATVNSTVLLDLWSSLGPELVIFVVTVIFALAFQGTSRHLFQRKQKKVLEGKPQDEPPPREFSAQPPTSSTSSASNVGQRVQPWRGASQAGGNQARQKSPAEQVDAIFALTKGTPSQAAASQVLQLYSELRLKVGLRSETCVAHAPTEAQERFSSELRGHTALDLFTILVQAAVRAQQAHLVERLIADMVALNVHRPVSFYESTMKQLAGQKQHRLALAVYDRLSTDGLEPSVVTYSCLIHFAADVGQTDRALEFFEKLRLLSTPSIRAYMTVLRLFAQRSDWPSALATYRDMQSRGAPVDNLAFNIVLSVGISADKMAEAEAFLFEGEEKGEVKPDLVSYNTVVKGFARRSDVKSVRRLLARACEAGHTPNAITYNTLLDALVRSHTTSSEVVCALDEMRNAGHTPDKFTCSILVRAVALHPTSRNLSATLKALAEANAQLDERSMASHYNALLEAANSISEDLLSMQCKTMMRERGIAVNPTNKGGGSGQAWRSAGDKARGGAPRPSRVLGA
jgi:pentatricopeptide repeat protein